MENRNFKDSMGVDTSFIGNDVLIINWSDDTNSDINITDIIRCFVDGDEIIDKEEFIEITDCGKINIVKFDKDDLRYCLEEIKNVFDNTEDENDTLGFSKSIPAEEITPVCPRCGKDLLECQCFYFNPPYYIAPEISVEGNVMDVKIDVSHESHFGASLNKIKEVASCLPDVDGDYNQMVVLSQHLGFGDWDKDNCIEDNLHVVNESGYLDVFHTYKYPKGEGLKCSNGHYPTIYVEDVEQSIRLLTIDPWVSIVIPCIDYMSPGNVYIDLSGETLSFVYFHGINKYFFIHPMEVRNLLEYDFVTQIIIPE